jgi:uncharacterized protein (DUF1778 family)
MSSKRNRTKNLGLRLSGAMKRTLEAGAVAAGKSVNDFVIESALMAAQEQLANRRVLMLDRERYDAFVAVLERPSRPNRRLKRLFSEHSRQGAKNKP